MNSWIEEKKPWLVLRQRGREADCLCQLCCPSPASWPGTLVQPQPQLRGSAFPQVCLPSGGQQCRAAGRGSCKAVGRQVSLPVELLVSLPNSPAHKNCSGFAFLPWKRREDMKISPPPFGNTCVKLVFFLQVLFSSIHSLNLTFIMKQLWSNRYIIIQWMKWIQPKISLSSSCGSQYSIGSL